MVRHSTFRRSLTVGVALAGAGAVTWAMPLAMPYQQDDIAIPRAAAVDVQPMSLATYAEVLATGAAETVQQSLDALLVTSPALWEQIVAQWPDADQTHWNYALVTDSALAPLAPLAFGSFNDSVTQVLSQQFPDRSAEIAQLQAIAEYSTVRAIGPLLSGIGAAGAAHSQIFYSMSNWELPPFFDAVAAAPVTVVDGLLYGGYGDLSPLLTGEAGHEHTPAPGLLTPWSQDPPVRDIKWKSEPETDVVATAADADTDVDTEMVTAKPKRLSQRKVVRTGPERNPLAKSIKGVRDTLRDTVATLRGAKPAAGESDSDTAPESRPKAESKSESKPKSESDSKSESD